MQGGPDPGPCVQFHANQALTLQYLLESVQARPCWEERWGLVGSGAARRQTAWGALDRPLGLQVPRKMQWNRRPWAGRKGQPEQWQ